jgi:hypothetical protein
MLTNKLPGLINVLVLLWRRKSPWTLFGEKIVDGGIGAVELCGDI